MTVASIVTFSSRIDIGQVHNIGVHRCSFIFHVDVVPQYDPTRIPTVNFTILQF
jgi:hypothetical protein